MLAMALVSGVGVAAGMRHALEPDHVATVASMSVQSRGRASLLRSAVLWGAGHGVVLVLVATVLQLLRAQVPPHIDAFFEYLVGAMLVVLGARAVWVSLSPVPHHHAPAASRPGLVLPLVIGAVHGLSGSGAVAALAASRAASPVAAFAMVVLYAAGALFGMALLAGALGHVLRRITASSRVSTWSSRASGALSLVLGLVWLAPLVLH
jgi:hypothetical protein